MFFSDEWECSLGMSYPHHETIHSNHLICAGHDSMQRASGSFVFRGRGPNSNKLPGSSDHQRESAYKQVMLLTSSAVKHVSASDP